MVSDLELVSLPCTHFIPSRAEGARTGHCPKDVIVVVTSQQRMYQNKLNKSVKMFMKKELQFCFRVDEGGLASPVSELGSLNMVTVYRQMDLESYF